jgi:hypothetical protein
VGETVSVRLLLVRKTAVGEPVGQAVGGDPFGGAMVASTVGEALGHTVVAVRR